LSSNKEEFEPAQCPCGRIISHPSEYKLLFLKKEQNEIDILCPNDTCYLRELGYITFRIDDDGNVKVEKISFYPPFVTWNVGRMGREKATKVLKAHLRWIVKKGVDWEKIKEDYMKRSREREEEEIAVTEEEITE